MAPSSLRKRSGRVAGKKFGTLRIWRLRIHPVALQKDEAVTPPLSDSAHMAEPYCRPPWPKQLVLGAEVMRPGVTTKMLTPPGSQQGVRRHRQEEDTTWERAE
jgi:hypothetical protein